jgi:hypothetical protein
MASNQSGFSQRAVWRRAVTRPKVCADLEVLRPSERQWKPRLRQAALRYSQCNKSAVEKNQSLRKKREKSFFFVILIFFCNFAPLNHIKKYNL